MIDQRKLVLEWLRGEAESPALRYAYAFALDAATEIASASPVRQTAREAFSTWSVRLLNAAVKGRRLIGLPALVRSLGALDPNEEVAQIALRHGLKVGLVFYAPANGQVLGAVISIRTEADVKRSEENFRFAQSGRKPEGVVRASTRKRPAIAALEL